jgi:hypothetical protein
MAYWQSSFLFSVPVAMDTDNELQLSFVLSNRYGNGMPSLCASVINK